MADASILECIIPLVRRFVMGDGYGRLRCDRLTIYNCHLEQPDRHLNLYLLHKHTTLTSTYHFFRS